MPTPRKRATSQDVANLAGVSRATVSMVLNDRTEGTVSTGTRKKVLEAAKTLQYTRSRAALTLREKQTRTIGIISDEIMTSPWAGRMLRAANQTAHERGYFTLSMDRSIAGITQESAIHTLLEREVDGLLIATMGAVHVAVDRESAPVPIALLNCFNTHAPEGSVPPPDFMTAERFMREENPTVSVTGPTLFPEFVPDDYEGGFRAARRLIDVGHERIAVFTGDETVIAKQARDAGFFAACREAGIKPRFVTAGWNLDDGFRAGTQVLAEPVERRPTGIFCIRDRVAAGLLQAAALAGVDVPHEMSIIGFDDEDYFAECLTPPLTTIALPHIEMGRAAMSALIDEIERPKSTVPDRAIFRCPLVERGTVARPAENVSNH